VEEKSRTEIVINGEESRDLSYTKELLPAVIYYEIEEER
jgi:hypothetical protein